MDVEVQVRGEQNIDWTIYPMSSPYPLIPPNAYVTLKDLQDEMTRRRSRGIVWKVMPLSVDILINICLLHIFSLFLLVEWVIR